MIMSPAVRKVALTAHVATSVGWLGAVASFLALAIAGIASDDAQIVRAAYLAMESTTWFVIVPLGFASLLTGLVVSLGTAWGLFRHYWVVAKLLITILATILLLVHTQPIGFLAAAARETAFTNGDISRVQIQIVMDAAIALLALLANVALSVFKPWGMTSYGLRTQQRRAADAPVSRNTEVEIIPAVASSTPRWVYVVGIHGIVLAVLFVVMHFAGGGTLRH